MKTNYEITPIEEKTSSEAVKVEIEELPDIQPKEEKAPTGVSENIKANLTSKPYTKEYVSGAVFGVLSIAGILIGFLIEGYKVAGIVCFALGGLASFALLNHARECKKVMSLLESGECKTVGDLMVKMKKRNKYEFLRALGGMVREGHLVGYEIVDGNEIRKVQ